MIMEWDDKLPAEARTHDFVRMEKLCSHHSRIHGNDHKAAFDANFAENRQKNKVFAIVQAMKGPNHPNESFKWSFDEDRNLTVDFGNSLTNQEKAQLRANMDIQFGKDKVRMP
jgi:hypothetical protein